MVSFRYTFFEVAEVTIIGAEILPGGKVTLKTVFAPDGSKEGGGIIKFFVNGKPASEGKLKRFAFRHGLEPFEVGRDLITPMSTDYKTPSRSPAAPFALTGSIEKIAVCEMHRVGSANGGTIKGRCGNENCFDKSACVQCAS